MLTSSILLPYTHATSYTYFDLCVNPHINQTDITMRVFTKDVTTTRMHYTTKLLENYLPTILESTCFNEDNLPFVQEVTSTEIGHLFEHILLEYLCIEKIQAGNDEALFCGVTKWDWNKDAYGTFHIIVDVSENDHEFVAQALRKSISLLKKILRHHQMTPVAMLSS